MHVLQLPITDAKKQGLLQRLGVQCDPSGVQLEADVKHMDQLLLAARVHCLSKVEAYFLQADTDLLRPINVRNEAAAISLLQTMLADAGAAVKPLQEQLAAHCESLWPEFACGDINLCGREPPPPTYPSDAAGPESAFERWAAEQGIVAGIRLASYGGLRGCAASRDLIPGDKMLSIPRHVLIYEDTIKETDLGCMLKAIPGLPTDTLLILFNMIDRHDPESKWAPLWASLPEDYYTGLSFPPSLVEELEGTAAALEIKRAQEHLRRQYADTRPLFDMLLAAYPQHLEASWFTYEAYLWAVELWYSYAFEVEFPGREGAPSVPVMVPFACHVNHSPWPTVVRYGRVNPGTDTLDYPAFRPCQQGQQAFISYGPVPNLKLLCYYGFVIPNNPHDLVLLQLEPPEGELAEEQQAALAGHELTLEHNLQDGPLSKQVLACLRVIVATREELQAVLSGQLNPLREQLSAENEQQALETLQAALLSMLEPLRCSPLLAVSTSSPPAQQQQQQQQQQGGTEGQQQREGEQKRQGAQVSKNENGLDAEWVMSRQFCSEYVRGQVKILERSLQEVRKLLAGKS